MAKGERGAQGPAGKLIKPTEPLFPKTPQQVSSPVCVASPLVVIRCNVRSLNHTVVTHLGTSKLLVSGVFAAHSGLRVSSHDWMEKGGGGDGKCDRFSGLSVSD